MACPYLKEVVMLSCEAAGIKKYLPLDRLATGDPCLGEFHDCPFFHEVVARLARVDDCDRAPADRVAATAGKEGRQ
jgi:hypothetical protein